MRYKTNTVMTELKRMPRIRAVILPSASPDPTVVRPEVWEGLVVEVVERLGGANVVEIFGADGPAEILESWLRNGLTSRVARQHANALRKVAFQQEGDDGAAPVRIANDGKDQAPPGVLTTLAAVFDYLAALAPHDGQIRFEHEVAE